MSDIKGKSNLSIKSTKVPADIHQLHIQTLLAGVAFYLA
ncbi:MAG: hypothetical protein ACJAV1_002276 [Paraglaciecola sp.]|jgi:hypothetical protein